MGNSCSLAFQAKGCQSVSIWGMVLNLGDQDSLSVTFQIGDFSTRMNFEPGKFMTSLKIPSEQPRSMIGIECDQAMRLSASDSRCASLLIKEIGFHEGRDDC